MIDKGHEELLTALANLYHAAELFQFNDFKNTQYPVPKVALVKELQNLIERVKKGDFDNEY